MIILRNNNICKYDTISFEVTIEKGILKLYEKKGFE